MIKFWILVTVNPQDTNQIQSAYSPDLNAQLVLDSSIDAYQALVLSNAKKEIESQANYLLVAQTPKELSKYPIFDKQHQYWELFEVGVDKGRFAKALPLIGYVATISTIASTAVITYMALRIASDSPDPGSSSSSNALSITGTTLSSIITFALYVQSNASQTLTSIGGYVDHTFARLCNMETKDNSLIEQDADKRKYLTKVCLYLIVTGSILVNTVISSISLFQEAKLIVERFMGLDQESQSSEDMQKQIFMFIVYVGVISGAYSSTSFQASFVDKIVNGILNKIYKQANQRDLGVRQDKPRIYTAIDSSDLLINSPRNRFLSRLSIL